MEISFTGLNILVTGAGQGIGRAIAKQLVACGANVFALSRTERHLKSLADEEPTIRTVCVDLGDWEATKTAIERLPLMDGLVNNAAIAELGPFLEVTADSIDRQFNINVKSVINVSQIIAGKLVAAGKPGSIVNLSSQAGKAALKDHTVYCGTKGALEMITQVMALELGPHQIRVNSVNPTVVLTEMGRLGWSNPEKAASMLSKIPLGRFAQVDEVVNAVLFLLSSRASMINGVYLPVDGGFLAC